MILNNLIKLHGKKYIKILKCLIFDLYILKKNFKKKIKKINCQFPYFFLSK
jgi:hypothetical protein